MAGFGRTTRRLLVDTDDRRWLVVIIVETRSLDSVLRIDLDTDRRGCVDVGLITGDGGFDGGDVNLRQRCIERWKGGMGFVGNALIRVVVAGTGRRMDSGR